MTRLASRLCLVFALVLASCTSTTTNAPTALRAQVPQPLLLPILHDGREHYQLVERWTFDRPQGHTEPVPIGLVVDGASVPRFVWPFMAPDGLHRSGALAHDWLYLHRGTLPDGCSYTRADADLLFYDLLRDAGVGSVRAGIAYRALRLAGWAAWNSVEFPTILPVDHRALAAPRVIKPRHVFSHLYAP